jgi:putative endopeptidase
MTHRRLPLAPPALAVLIAALVAASALAAPKPGAAAKPAAAKNDAPSGRLVDAADMDTTCAPCKDFYQYVNGGWMARTELPPSYPALGTFQEISDRNQETLHTLLDDAVRRVKGEKPGSNEWKLGVFYGACMDSERAEKEGAKPLDPAFARIAAVKDVPGLMSAVAWLQGRTGGGGRGGPAGVMFRAGGLPDPKNSTTTIATIAQGGISLPDRDYYLKDDPKSKETLEAFRAHIGRTFQLLGETAEAADADAGKVLAIETQLARASLTNVEMRDPQRRNNKIGLTDLEALAPAVGWKSFFTEAGFPAFTEVNTIAPDFFKALNGMLASVPVEDWKTYLRWHVVNTAAPLLSSAFVKEDFSFAQKLTGAREMQPRWKRCIGFTDGALGEAVGEAWVAKEFPPAAKARAVEMVKNLEAALQDRLSHLEWMGDATRAQAIAKLTAFTNKIGYPDKWRDYSKLTLDPASSFYDDRVAAARFERQRLVDRVGGPWDRADWGMTPPTVNAYYNPPNNEIVFPAGILQPPFFDMRVDDAYLYGAIGSVIGHEMTHGFDDSGRQFDAQGNLRDWWTPDDAAHFKQRADRVVAQYNGYVGVDTLHVNGRLTLGENIADLGGMAIAYQAYERSLQGKERRVIDGYTPEQRFFIGYARNWRGKFRPEAIRTRVLSDPHSPNYWRANGPLSNLPEFWKAWGCKPGDGMVRPDSLLVRIW